MLCINPECTSTDTKVVETTTTPTKVYRRRVCPSCGERYVTIEVFHREGRMPAKSRKKNDLQAQ